MKHLNTVFLAVLCALCPLAGRAQNFAGGSGTEAAPWIIETPEQMDNMRRYLGEKHKDRHFKLGNDIDLSDYAYETYGAAGWEPVGTHESIFMGNLDGDGHTVTGLWINRPEAAYIGLFGIHDGTVKNISITTDDERGGIKGHNAVGGVAGISYGAIINCHVTASISGNNHIGGLAGIAGHRIEDSHSAGTVTAVAACSGGLVGRNEGSITNSHSTCTVTGGDYACGGLVGSNANYSSMRSDDCNIINCYATGAVTGSNNSCGGLVGHSFGAHITGCYATGAVTGSVGCGGLIGVSYNGPVTGCYATGAVTGDFDCGGLIGDYDGTFQIDYEYGRITDCYATGAVKATVGYCGGLTGRANGSIVNSYAAADKIMAIESDAGGLVGYNMGDDTFLNCYYLKTDGASRGAGDGSESGITAIPGDADMKKGDSFPGFFEAGTRWTIAEGKTWPYLRGAGRHYPGTPAAVLPAPDAGSSPAVTAAGGALTVSTPQAETVTVYSPSGTPVYRAQKGAGAATLHPGRLPQGVYIVHGSSGWARKVVFQ
jgi:hypothetical protein